MIDVGAVHLRQVIVALSVDVGRFAMSSVRAPGSATKIAYLAAADHLACWA